MNEPNEPPQDEPDDAIDLLVEQETPTLIEVTPEAAENEEHLETTQAEVPSPTSEALPSTLEEWPVLEEDPEPQERREHVRFGELEPNQVYCEGDCRYLTDEQGRVSEVEGFLHLGEGERTAEQTRVGHEGLPTDDGGHLIGYRFEGSSEGYNLLPQDANLNRGQWRSMEEEWATALDAGKQVEVGIIPHYQGESNRPESFEVVYNIIGEYCMKTFRNEREGLLEEARA